MRTVYATLKGFEAMRSPKKGQASAFQVQEGILGEIRLVERCFHVGDCALAEGMTMMNTHFQKEAS
jgi:hypothetical protein